MTILDKRKLQTIHSASVAALRDIGMRVMDEKLRGTLSRCGLDVRGDRVFFDENTLMNLIQRAPGEFLVHSRAGNNGKLIGRGAWALAPGYGCTSVVEHDKAIRPAVFADYLRFNKWIQASDEMDFYGGLPVQPVDTPEHSPAFLIAAAMALSDKCLLGIPAAGKELDAEFTLLKTVFGGEAAFCSTPKVMFLISTNSPLNLDYTNCEVLMKCCEHRQVQIVSPGPMQGATSPVTASGTIVTGNAEALAVIAMIQAISPGNPVIYGVHPTVMNLQKASVSIGTPVFSTLCAASLELAAYYGLPGRGAGAVTDADFVGIQSAYESAMSLGSGQEHGAAFVLHGAGILSAYGAMSYEKFLLDLELIRRQSRYSKDMDVSDGCLALDVITDSIGGGGFIAQPHTAEHCRQESYIAGISQSSLEGLHFLHAESEKMDTRWVPPRDMQEIQRAAGDVLGSFGYASCDFLKSLSLCEYI